MLIKLTQDLFPYGFPFDTDDINFPLKVSISPTFYEHLFRHLLSL